MRKQVLASYVNKKEASAPETEVRSIKRGKQVVYCVFGLPLDPKVYLAS
jgi:hypothetical protein